MLEERLIMIMMRSYPQSNHSETEEMNDKSEKCSTKQMHNTSVKNYFTRKYGGLHDAKALLLITVYLSGNVLHTLGPG